MLCEPLFFSNIDNIWHAGYLRCFFKKSFNSWNIANFAKTVSETDTVLTSNVFIIKAREHLERLTTPQRKKDYKRHIKMLE